MENKSIKIATPISHLFMHKGSAEKIIEASDCLECRDYSFNVNYPQEEVFHCNLQPIHFLSRDDYYYLENIKKVKKELRLISFHMASCYDAPEIKNGIFVPGGNKIEISTLKKNAKKNFSKIKQLFGRNVIIAVENNNYYKTEAYDFVTQPDFISDIVKQNNINFLFDIAHAKIAAVNQGVDFEDYVNLLPMDVLIQIHISQPGFNEQGEIKDKHKLPSRENVIDILKLIGLHSNLKYITVEYYQDIKRLIKFLNYLRLKINE